MGTGLFISLSVGYGKYLPPSPLEIKGRERSWRARKREKDKKEYVHFSVSISDSLWRERERKEERHTDIQTDRQIERNRAVLNYK